MLKIKPAKTLLVRIHWMKHYQGDQNDPPYAGGQSSDGWMENFNFLNYEGSIFGGFWPGRRRKGDDDAKDVNVDRLGAAGELSAKGVTVIYFAPHPKDGVRRLVGWHDSAEVFRRIQLHPDDGQQYNVRLAFDGAHLVTAASRMRAFNFSPWWKQGPYRFGSDVPSTSLTEILSEMEKHAF